jgi:chromosome segregation ATPase
VLVERGKYMDNKELLQAISIMMDEKLEPINKRLGNIEDRVTSIEDRVTSIEDRVTSIEDRVTSIENRVTAIENRVTAIELEVKDIKKDISHVRKEMDARFDYLEASIEKVDRRLAYNTDLLKETDRAIMEDMDKIKLRA